jgi:methyltransferase (TIGR00027 family)
MNELIADDPKLSDVRNTGLITAICHAIESRSEKPLLRDPKAEAIADQLAPQLATTPDKILRCLSQGEKFAGKDLMVTGAALRARKYDEYARDFAQRHPGRRVVNLGCGLDTRFWRIDDGRLHLYDLDLPETIALKRQLVQESDRYHMIGMSVLDHKWLDHVAAGGAGPCLFLAEGLFMYLPPDEVQSLVLALESRFPGSELVCDVAPSWAVSPTAHWIGRLKGWSAEFHFGVRHSREFEAWSSGLRFLEEWDALAEDEPRLGFVRRLRKWGLMPREIWAIRYVLGTKDAAPN